MKLKVVGSNMTEVETDTLTVLFSYSTPVAAFMPGKGWVRTSKKWSMTTSRHINKWLDGVKAEEVPQATLDGLL